MTGQLVIRRAKIDNVVEFNALISSLGRVPLFRAIFGQYNYSSIVDFSHLSLIAYCENDANVAVGFVSITDSSCIDSLSFESAILELKPYVSVEVRTSFEFICV